MVELYIPAKSLTSEHFFALQCLFQFVGPAFQNLMKEFGIKHYFASRGTIHKSFAAERRIRYLRLLLARMLRSGHSADLYQLARRAETFINHHHENTVTGLTPQETTNRKGGHVLEKLRQSRAAQLAIRKPSERRARNPFSLGDVVAKKLPLSQVAGGKFTKTGDSQIDRRQNFLVIGVKPTGPRHSYRLRGLEDGLTLEGTYAPSQLHLVTDAPLMRDLRSSSATSANKLSAPSAVSAKNESSHHSGTSQFTRPRTGLSQTSGPHTRSRALFSRLESL